MLSISGIPFIKFVEFLGVSFFQNFEFVIEKYKQAKLQESDLQRGQQNKLKSFSPSKRALTKFLEGQKNFEAEMKQKKMNFQKKDIIFLRIVLILFNYTATEEDQSIPYIASHIFQKIKLKHLFNRSKSIQAIENKLFIGQKGIKERKLSVNESNLKIMKQHISLLFSGESYVTQNLCIQSMMPLVQEIASYLRIGTSSKSKIKREF